MKKLYDLTHVLDQNTYHPFGSAYFRNEQTWGAKHCRHAYITMSLHFGTHMDAPWHMLENGKTLDAISIQELAGPAVAIDVSDKYSPDKAELEGISLEAVKESLAAAGNTIQKGDAVIVYTGWKKLFYSDPVRYFESYSTMSHEACKWLLDQGVRLIALDVSDIDLPKQYATAPFDPINHKLVLERGVYVIENVGGEIETVLGRRIYLLPAPLNLGGEYASGAPIRLIAAELEG
jgi:arylformamidase